MREKSKVQADIELPKPKEALYKEERVLSMRMSGNWVKIIEEQGKKWNTNTSETLRRILRFYFLPMLIEREWNELKAEKEKLFGGSPKRKQVKLETLNFYHEEAMSYLEWLVDVQEQNLTSFNYLKEEIEKMSSIAEAKNKEYIEAITKAKLFLFEEQP